MAPWGERLAGISAEIKDVSAQSVMVYTSETWAVRVEEEQRMERNENVMLRWMCGVTLRDKVPTVELRRRFGIEGVVEVMRRCKLRWFRHVERKKVDD